MVRKGWADMIKEELENNGNEKLIPDVFSDEDFEDWQWQSNMTSTGLNLILK